VGPARGAGGGQGGAVRGPAGRSVGRRRSIGLYSTAAISELRGGRPAGRPAASAK